LSIARDWFVSTSLQKILWFLAAEWEWEWEGISNCSIEKTFEMGYKLHIGMRMEGKGNAIMKMRGIWHTRRSERTVVDGG